jgi:hypothetical protein
MLILFYVFNALHWWANLELVIYSAKTSTLYNLIIFGISVFVIAMMLWRGSKVNAKSITHQFYVEKISEEKQRQAEETAKAASKLANEQARAGTMN